MLSLVLALQVVGSPIPPVEVKVTQARRVGQTLTVDYTVRNNGTSPVPMPPPSTVVDAAGRALPTVRLRTGRPGDRPRRKPVIPSSADVAPGAIVGQTVVFDFAGARLDRSVYGMDVPTFNQSTWYFVIGGQRIPFGF